MRSSRSGKATIIIAAVAATLGGIRISLGGAIVSPFDILVAQVNGDGGPGNNDSVTINEFSVASLQPLSATVTSYAAPVNQINLPVSSLSYNGSTGLGLTLPDTGDNDGQLTLAADGHTLEMATYLDSVGSAAANGSGTFPDAVPRVITVIHPDGSIDDSTQLTADQDSNGNFTNYIGVSIRSVLSLDGKEFWTTGNGGKPVGVSTSLDVGGLRYTTYGSNTSLSLNSTYGVDLRTPLIYNGQLFAAGGSNNSPAKEHTLNQVGVGIPTANSGSGAPNFTNAPAYVPLKATGAGVFATGDIQGNQSSKFATLANGTEILYESNSTSDSLNKYVLINGVWTGVGLVSIPDGGPQDIAVSVVGNTATIFVSSYNNLFELNDTGGSGPIPGNSVLTDANSVYGFPNTTAPLRGISFAPSSSAAVANQIWGSLTGTGSTGGSWGQAANWADGMPNAAGATATFGPSNPGLLSSGTVTLDGSKTVGHIVFNNTTANYTLAAGSGGSLIINNADSNATGVPSIYNTNGTHVISAPITLAAGVTIADEFQSSLTLAGAIGGSGGMQVYGPGSLTLSGSNNYAGDTVIHSGAVSVTATGSLPTTTNLTVGDPTDLLAVNIAVGTTAPVTIAASAASGIRPVTLASLTMQQNGTLSLVSPTIHANRSVLVLGGLNFAGSTNAWAGSLDLAGNDMIVHNGSLANITNQIKQGYNLTAGGYWNGSAGLTSSAAADDASRLTALGVISNSSGLYTLFDGQPVNTSDVLVKYTLYGDANLDGHVDGSDYTLIDNGFNLGLHGWLNGDFNYDGVVDGSDYSLIDNAFDANAASLASIAADAVAADTSQIAGPATSSVPEPVTLGLMTCLPALVRRRQKTKG